MSEEVQNDGSTKPALEHESAAPVVPSPAPHAAPPDTYDASTNVSQTSITQVNTVYIAYLTLQIVHLFNELQSTAQ